jgi:hypothetical protein
MSCYIGRLELELYDLKQEKAVGQALFATAVGALLIFLGYSGYTDTTKVWTYTTGGLFIVGVWVWYWREWNNLQQPASHYGMSARGAGFPVVRTRR